MATIPSDGSPMLGEHIFSAEDAAFEKRTLLNILDSIHESILIIDAQTRVCYVNDSYLKMFGIQREKIIGRHLAKFEPLARIHEVLKTGVPLTGDISHIHSAQLDVCADIVPLCQDGRIIGALALMKNMTELVQTNRELEHFKQLSEHLQNELASKDDLPPAFRNVLGHSKSFVTVLRTAARGRPQRGQHLHHGGERRRQGGSGGGPALQQPPRRRPAHQNQLRRHSGESDGKRAVRL